MRILYDKSLNSADVSATNENPNFPIENINHPFVSKKFKSLLGSSLITGIFDNEISIDSFGIAFHNVDEMTLSLYDSGDSLLYQEIISVAEFKKLDMYYFNLVENVKYFTLSADSLQLNLEIGAVKIGKVLEMPSFLGDPEVGDVLNSDITVTPEGQVLGVKRSILFAPSFSFPEVSSLESKNIDKMVSEVGNIDKIFIDIYEDTPDELPPFCGRITEKNKTKINKEGVSYSMTMSFREVR